MKVRRQSANKPTPLRWLQALIFIVFTGLTLQVPAAGDNQSTASNETATPTQTAQQDESTTDRASKEQEQPMEEVTVIGQKMIFSLRHQVIRAEDHAFEIFNILNDDDEFDIHCRMEARTGTHVKRRTCLPNFYYDASAAVAQEQLSYIGTSTYTMVVPSVRNVFSIKYPIFKDKVKKLAMKNPDFADAVHRLFVLTEELKATRNIYHGFNEE